MHTRLPPPDHQEDVAKSLHTNLDVKTEIIHKGEKSGSISSTATNLQTHRDSNGGLPPSHKMAASDNGNGGGDTDTGEPDIIAILIGQFGKWQFLMTMLLSLFQVPNTFHISSSVYQVNEGITSFALFIYISLTYTIPITYHLGSQQRVLVQTTETSAAYAGKCLA